MYYVSAIFFKRKNLILLERNKVEFNLGI